MICSDVVEYFKNRIERKCDNNGGEVRLRGLRVKKRYKRINLTILEFLKSHLVNFKCL